MGLFSSVIHVRDRGGSQVADALAQVVPHSRFKLLERRGAAASPGEVAKDSLLYLVSPLKGAWSTIVQGHFYVQNGPNLPELARSLSRALETYTLALAVHDDDILLYELFWNGNCIDRYNSNPQYFEQARLPDERIKKGRHLVQPFTPLLPQGVSIAQVHAILDRGWWSAWLGGRIDEAGLSRRDEPCYVFAGERMTDLGNLLQLHGRGDGYPFAGWAEEPGIEWREFQQLLFHRA